MRQRPWSTLAMVLVMAASAHGALEAASIWGTGAGGHRLWRDGVRVPLRYALHAPIPAFSRQTKLPCTACHTTFPQLTQFGRLFKLNGYTLAGVEQVRANNPDTAKGPVLALDLIPPVSVMAQASLTHLSEELPGTQNDNAEFPQQLSLFVGEAITPRLGTFLQLTYSSVDGTIGIDNADIRLAKAFVVAQAPTILGLTLNNNPTVQDVFNTVPAWSFPFATSSVAPTPAAAPLLFGDLAGRVAGLGGYAYWRSLVYAELSGYRSAPQGGPHPRDSTATGTLAGLAPYWRLALTPQLGANTFEVGTFGMSIHQYPTGVHGPTDSYLDFGLDAQWQRELPGAQVAAHATWVRERQKWNASFPAGEVANASGTLHTWRLDASAFFPSARAGGTIGYFNTTGTGDAILYAPASVTGSGNGLPNSNGFIGEIDFNPWLNARFSAQYIGYGKFNGASSNYDAAGRSASNNNALYLVAWLIF